MENGVYKGEETHQSTKYKSLGELMWVSITSHEDKIAHVSRSLHVILIFINLQEDITFKIIMFY